MKRLVMIATLALFVAACSSNGTTGAQSPSPTPRATESVRAANAVDVDDNVFRERITTVSAGTTVTWTHIGKNQHTVQSTKNLFNSNPSCQVKGNGPAFKESTNCMNPGDTFTFTFTAPGHYQYYCLMHSVPDNNPDTPPGGMGGTVIVT
ncbi:MAG: hypothetical protein LC750_13345 [Actinobacteria bacterium]|nr:hypothetical protein [Actinomycetota bacterium]